MKLTNDQRDATRIPGDVLLEACPGSGKTTTLIAKLLRCADDVRDSVRRVGCITYTNAAVHEIEHRLRLYAIADDEERFDIATIHSFCLRNILGPFHWMLPEYRDGFEVAAPDSEAFQSRADTVADDFLLNHRSARESFEVANRLPDGSPVVRPPTPPEAVLQFWDSLSSDGLIDFTNIVFRSFELLTQHPSLLSSIQAKYAWVLLDEFQDTTALQVELLKLIADGERTRFFLVGDTRQSIFGFAGSDPSLMSEFGNHVGATQGPPLVENFRSSWKVVEHAERLLEGSAPMEAKGEWADYGAEPKLVECENPFVSITDHFLPALADHGIGYGDAAVLAAQWFSLYPLAGRLREFGVPVVGPGARPYRRLHFYASLAEQLCAQAENPRPDRIRQVEREVFFLLNDLTGDALNSVYSFRGRMVIERLIRLAHEKREQHDGALAWLRESAEEVGAVLQHEGWLGSADVTRLVESVDGMVADMEKNDVDVENLLVSDLGMFADPAESLKLLTLHRAKGREFDAVAIIDVHDGMIPHSSAKTEEAVDEGRRLFYVGITRAKRLLFYFTSSENWRPLSRFLGPGELELLDAP